MAEIIETSTATCGASRAKAAPSGSVPILDIIFMTLRHWPWIILSVAICVGAAYLWLLRTPNVYSRSAEILIKDESKGNSVGADEFANMGLFQSNTNLQNEIYNLKSKDMMEEVVRRIGLDINYFKDGRFHDQVAYGTDLPVRVATSGYPEESSLSFTLKVDPAGQVTVKDFVNSDGSYGKSYTGRLNSAIATPGGSIVVTPSPLYIKGSEVELKVKKYPLSAARDSYNARLQVAMSNDNSSIIKLTVFDESTQRADDLLNTLIDVYNENWIHDKNQIAVSTSNFIDERLGVIQNELGNVDSDISSYKSANLIPDVGAAASMYMSQNQETQAQILDLNNQLSMARYIRSYLVADAGHGQLLPANTGLQSGNVQSMIGEYNSKLLQRNTLADKSSEANPLVQQYDQQLAAQRQAIIRSIDNEITALNTRLSTLRGTQANAVSKLASNPTQAKNLLSVERQQKVKESLYLFLLQKREENELSQAFTAYNTRIVNKPGPSGLPSTPNRGQTLLIAFVIGLVIPFGVTAVKELSNTRIRGRKDVEHLTAPFAGEIPQNGPAKKEKDSDAAGHRLIVVGPGNRNIINESFRVLRTNVEFLCNSIQGGRAVAFTSFNPGSGKSFISVNLGMAIALKEKRVLVIDGDMRHGSVSQYVGSPELGLADYLSGMETDVDRLIVPYNEVNTLFILPVGSIPPNPTELLESPRFGELVSQLKTQYDYVIIDCPPIEVVADAQIIDKYMDRTFFIIRAGLFERSMLPELDRLYDEKKYSNMAFILNGTPNDQGRYGYSHSYRYGYGYGYGYGYNYGSDEQPTPGHKQRHHQHNS